MKSRPTCFGGKKVRLICHQPRADSCMWQYLGVQNDCNLFWKEQIKTASSKVSRVVGFLKNAKSFLPRESLTTLYTGIMELHSWYCCSVWDSTDSTEINQLQNLLNCGARIVTNSSYTPSRPVIESLGWKTIHELIQNESETMVSTMGWLHHTCVVFSPNAQKCFSFS